MEYCLPAKVAHLMTGGRIDSENGTIMTPESGKVGVVVGMVCSRAQSG